jgi:hypothetical protein
MLDDTRICLLSYENLPDYLQKQLYYFVFPPAVLKSLCDSVSNPTFYGVGVLNFGHFNRYDDILYF